MVLNIYAFDEYDEMEAELIAIETNISLLRKQVIKSRTIGKIRYYGDIRFSMEATFEEVSPIDVTNKLNLNDKNLGTGIHFHYEPGKNIVFNAGMNISTGIDGNYSGSVSMMDTDFYLNTFLKIGMGSYNIFFGGPWWINSTALTFFSLGYQYKAAPFERNSWDYVGTDYAWIAGAGIREADQRAEGARGIKGIRIEGWNFIGKLWGTFFIGKQDGAGNDNFNYIHYGRLEQPFGRIRVGVAYAALLENPENKREFNKKNYNYAFYSKGPFPGGFKYYIEGGLSHAYVKDYPEIDGSAVIGSLSRRFRKLIILQDVPMDLEWYYIPPDFIGEISGVNHTYKEIPLGWSTPNPDPQEITLYNNRYGGSIKSGFKVFDGNIQFLIGQTKNIVPSTNNVSFSHGLDHYQWWLLFDQWKHWYSGETLHPDYWPEYWNKDGTWNPQGGGNPNQAALTTYWQGASENARILDKKSRIRHFNIVTFNFGYDISRTIRFIDRTYLGFNTYWKSIENKVDLFPLEHQYKDLLWGYSYDWFLAYGIIKSMYIIGYYGIEIWESLQTNPFIDQEQKSWGLGWNYEFIQAAAIYLRLKRYQHFDYIRWRNNFKGYWLSAEVKSYF